MLWICAAHSRKIKQNKGGKNTRAQAAHDISDSYLAFKILPCFALLCFTGTRPACMIKKKDLDN